jgi:hypothetical protein
MDAFLFPKLLARKEIDCFQNPIIVIAASDIVDLLRKNGYADPEIVDDWLAREFPREATADSTRLGMKRQSEEPAKPSH